MGQKITTLYKYQTVSKNDDGQPLLCYVIGRNKDDVQAKIDRSYPNNSYKLEYLCQVCSM